MGVSRARYVAGGLEGGGLGTYPDGEVVLVVDIHEVRRG